VDKIKVIIIQKSFSNYRKAIFDSLNRDYKLYLLHSESNTGINQITSDFSIVIKKMKYAHKNTAVYLFCLKEIFRIRPKVVIHEFTPSILSIYTIFFFKFFLKYKVVLWGHGFNRKKPINFERSIAFHVRKLLIGFADAVIFYNERNKNIINSIIPSDKYFVAYNSLNTTLHQKIRYDLNKLGKEKIKNELGIPHKHNIVFVGRLLEEKILPDIFIEAIIKVTNAVDDVGITIVGEGPAKKRMVSLVKNFGLKNVYFKGSIHDEVLVGKYIYVSDLMFVPGCLGLAINHAFDFLTPVVSFSQGKSGPFHGPEIGYLKHNKNGYLAKPFNTNECAEFIATYLKDENLQMLMRKEILSTISGKCNLNSMKKGFDQAIDYSLNSK
jgi:glycosyltransferase involved in cell wall biosynthesis